MKKAIKSILPLILYCFVLPIKAQQSTFSKVFYDSLGNGFQAHSFVPAVQNGYLIVGDSLDSKGLILRIDSLSSLLWNKTVSSNSKLQPNTYLRSVIRTNDSCFIITGSTFSTSSNKDALVLKLDSGGNILWARIISKSGYSLMSNDIEQTIDSGFILTGSANLSNAQFSSVLVSKLNKDGLLEWMKILTDSSNYNIGCAIKQASDSSYFIIGGTNSQVSMGAFFFLLNLAKDGSIRWSKKYASSSTVYGSDILVNSNKIYCSFNTGKAGLLSTDLNGTMNWSKLFAYSGPVLSTGESLQKITRLNDGGIILPHGNKFGGTGIAKIDTNGAIIFTKALRMSPLEIYETKSRKNLVILGNGPMYGLKTTGYDSPQIGLIRADSMASAQDCLYNIDYLSENANLITKPINFTIVDGGKDSAILLFLGTLVVSNRTRCVARFGGIKSLSSNPKFLIHPNPSNGRFSITSSEPAQIKIFNLMGSCVYNSTLLLESNVIDLSHEAIGVYFYTIKSENANLQNGKLIVQ